MMMHGGNEDRGARSDPLRSKPPALGTGEVALGRRLVRHTPPADVLEAERSDSKLQLVKAVDGRKDCVPVCDFARARGVNWHTCMGGHGITAASHAGAGAPPGDCHSEDSVDGRGRY